MWDIWNSLPGRIIGFIPETASMSAAGALSGMKVAIKQGRRSKTTHLYFFFRCRFGVQKINDENNARWELPQYSPGCRKLSSFEKRILKLKVSDFKLPI